MVLNISHCWEKVMLRRATRKALFIVFLNLNLLLLLLLMFK